MFELAILGELAEAMKHSARYIVWKKVADNQFEILAYCKDVPECNKYLNGIEKDNSSRERVVYGFILNKDFNDPGDKVISKLSAEILSGYSSLVDQSHE